MIFYKNTNNIKTFFSEKRVIFHEKRTLSETEIFLPNTEKKFKDNFSDEELNRLQEGVESTKLLQSRLLILKKMVDKISYKYQKEAIKIIKEDLSEENFKKYDKNENGIWEDEEFQPFVSSLHKELDTLPTKHKKQNEKKIQYQQTGSPKFEIPLERKMTPTLELLLMQDGKFSLKNLEQKGLVKIYKNFATDEDGISHSILLIGKDRPRGIADILLILLPTHESKNIENLSPFATNLSKFSKKNALKIIELEQKLMKSIEDFDKSSDFTVDSIQHFSSTEIFSHLIQNKTPTTSIVPYHKHIGYNSISTNKHINYTSLALNSKEISDPTSRLFYEYLSLKHKKIPHINKKNYIEIRNIETSKINETIEQLENEYSEFLKYLSEIIKNPQSNNSKNKIEKYINRIASFIKINKNNPNVKHIKHNKRGGIRITKSPTGENLYNIAFSPLLFKYTPHASVDTNPQNSTILEQSTIQDINRTEYKTRVREFLKSFE